MLTKVGIVIVTYNSEKEITRILDSILCQKYMDLAVYVVDSNSSDNTLNLIQKYRAKLSITIIRFKLNLGYAKGNNIGIQKAMDEGCDPLFILNPDMQLEEKCIDILIERIRLDDSIGVIGPIVLYGNNPRNIIQGYGAKINFKTQKKIIYYGGKELTKDIPSETYTDSVHGGAMMIRSSILKHTGLFEEDYFMYNDEIDISYRVKNAGFQMLVLRDAQARHHHDFSKKNRKGNNLMYYYMMRNKFLYFKKYHLYTNVFFSLVTEIVILPLTIRWASQRMGNMKLVKFYYSGLIDGLLGKKGISNKSFN